MKFRLFAAFFLLLTANAASGTKKTHDKPFVCNQYIGQGSETNKAIKKLDAKLSKKLDQIIKLLQPSAYPGENSKQFVSQFSCFT